VNFGLKFTRGVQCGGMVAYAIAASHTVNTSNWDTDFINQVILSGDDYYKTCQERLRLNLNPFNRYLAVEETFGIIKINGNEFILNFRDNDIINASREGRVCF